MLDRNLFVLIITLLGQTLGYFLLNLRETTKFKDREMMTEDALPVHRANNSYNSYLQSLGLNSGHSFDHLLSKMSN